MIRTLPIVTVAALLGAHAVPAFGQSLDGLTRVRDATSARASSAHAEAWSNGDNRWIKPGEVFTMADLKGAGVIRHIWLTFPESAPSWIAKEGSAAPDEIVVRMYWDGHDQPAVESPLGDFFGAGFGRRAEINSTPVQVQGAGGDSYNCFWPMPFFSGARITITNESSRPFAAFYYHVDYTREASLPDDTAYFCAQYRQEFPNESGKDYLVADIEAPAVGGPSGTKPGGGHYVGTVLSVRSRSPQWFGEGDDKFFIDGDPPAKPSIWGTGTEDYVLNAWGMERATFPTFGVTWLNGEWLGDLGNAGTMYRWHLDDPVRFTRSLRFELEHKGWMSADETTTGKVEGHVERNDDFATVAFWYQRGQPKRFTTLPPLKDRKLPSIDMVVEGKQLFETARSEGGSTSLQPGGFWTGEGQLFFDGQRVGSWVEFSFDAEKAERRRLVLPVTHSYDFGVYRVLLDGQPVAELNNGEPIDFYSPRIEVREYSLGDLHPTPGAHTIRLECVGVNPNSKGCKLGVDCVRLRERYAGKRAPLKPAK
ncbi:MAG: glycoside hydrolase family 172 protein [Phycisphaerales bacterium]